MKIDEIKNKILQLAIQGKLVPQDENDEPAAVLVERIKAEKERLIKEKKIKKEKPLPEISEDEKAFEIPEGWEWCRLNEIYRFIDYRGKTPNKIENGVPFITAKNVRMGYIDYSIQEYISTEEYEERKLRGVSKQGDILFTTEAPMGYVAIANLNTFSAGQRLITLQQYTQVEYIVNKLFMYYIMSPYFQKQLLDKRTGTTVYGIKAEKLKCILIPVPPPQEQKRIVAKVDELFAIVDEIGENKEALAKCISDTRNKVLQLAIQGKLVEQDATDEPASVLLEKIREQKEKLIKEKKIKKEKPLPEISEEEKSFEIPEGWEWVRLGEAVTVNGRKPISASNITDETWTLEMEDVEKNSSKLLNKIYNKQRKVSSSKNVFEVDDVLYAKLRPYLNKVLIANDKGVCSSEILPLQPIYVLSKYIKIYLKSTFYLNYANGLTAGVRMPRLGTEDIRKAVIPLPPIEEQKRIIAKVDHVMDYLEHLEKTLLV